MSPALDSTVPGTSGAWVTARPTRAREIAQRLVRLPQLVLANRDLVLTTLRRDLSSRFQGTLFGWAWPVFQPLFLFTVYYFIFTEFFQARMPDLPDSQKAGMGVYMFCGMIAWAALAESLARGTGVIVDNGNLIKKLAFPAELLPLNVVLASLTMMLFSLGIFLLVATFTPVWPHPGWQLLWLPVLLVVQGFFIYGCVLLLSTLQVFLRDTAQIVAMVVTVWMFATPIFWVPELLGERIANYLPLIHANPAFHMAAAWRGTLMGDVTIPLTDAAHPELARVLTPVSIAAIPEHLGMFALWALALYVLGYSFFVLSQRRFADEV